MAYRTTTQSLLILIFQNTSKTKHRPLHKIDIDTFKADILKSNHTRDPKGHLSDLCKQYYHVLKALLNKHASITTKSVSQKPLASVIILNEHGANQAPLWIGQVIQNSAITATHKWLKPNRIIIQTWSQMSAMELHQ